MDVSAAIPNSPRRKTTLLDNVTLYWLTNSGTLVRAAVYWENGARGSVISGGRAKKTGRESRLPVCDSRYSRRDVYRPPEDLGPGAPIATSSTSTKSIRAGTSAAWEQPELFSAELRAAFRGAPLSACHSVSLTLKERSKALHAKEIAMRVVRAAAVPN